MAAPNYNTGIIDWYVLKGITDNTNNNTQSITNCKWISKDSGNLISSWNDAIIVAFKFQINKNEAIQNGNVVNNVIISYKNALLNDTYITIDSDNVYTKNNVNTAAWYNDNIDTSIQYYLHDGGAHSYYLYYFVLIPKQDGDEQQQYQSANKYALQKDSIYNININIQRADTIYSKTISTKTANGDSKNNYFNNTHTEKTIYDANTYTYNARVKKEITKYQNGLYSLDTNITDTTPTSPDYFRITKCNDELMLGMSDFRFHLNPLYFKSEYPVYIELLDYNGNPVYYEIVNERNNLYNSTYIVFYITSDTAQGSATLTLAGHINKDIDGNIYDYDYINIKWVHTLYINPNKINNSDIIFSNNPIVRKIDNVVQNQYTDITSIYKSNNISKLFDAKIFNFTDIDIESQENEVGWGIYTKDSTGNFTYNIKSASLVEYTGYSIVPLNNTYIPESCESLNYRIEIRPSGSTEYKTLTPTAIWTISSDEYNTSQNTYEIGYIYSDNTVNGITTKKYIQIQTSIYNSDEYTLEYITKQQTINENGIIINQINENDIFGASGEIAKDSIKITLIDNAIKITSDTLKLKYLIDDISTYFPIDNTNKNIRVYKNNELLTYKNKSITLGNITTTESGYFIVDKNNELTDGDTWLTFTTKETDNGTWLIVSAQTINIHTNAFLIRNIYDLGTDTKVVLSVSDGTLYDDVLNSSIVSCSYNYDNTTNISTISFICNGIDSTSLKHTIDNLYANNSYIEIPATSFDNNNIYSDANIHLPFVQYDNNTNAVIYNKLPKTYEGDILDNYEIVIYSNSYLIYNMITSTSNNTSIIDTYIPTHLDITNVNNISFGAVYTTENTGYSLSQDYITFEITNFTPMQGYINSINCYWRDNRFDWIVLENNYTNSNTDTNNKLFIPKYHLLDIVDMSSVYPTDNTSLDYNYGIGYNYNEIRFQVKKPKYITPTEDENENNQTELIPCTIDYKFEFVNAYGKKCITTVMYIGDTYTE